jgi:hypothetical protein
LRRSRTLCRSNRGDESLAYGSSIHACRQSLGRLADPGGNRQGRPVRLAILYARRARQVPSRVR